MQRLIYADYNATTPPGKGAISAMNEAFQNWGNASSAHALGRRATEFLEQSRLSVARLADVDAKTVVFTSGGSEANTLALMGSYFLHQSDGFRLLTSTVEHSSVNDTASFLKGRGAQVERLPVNQDGQLDLSQLEERVRSFRPHLISLMVANNETGVLFPTEAIVTLCRREGIPLHVDAVQALGKIRASYWNGADLVAISGHKIYGPKGAGALIVRSGLKLAPTHFGGSQEIKRRGGTEGMIGIAGFGGACSDLPDIETLHRLEYLRDTFERTLTEQLEGITIVGGRSTRLPNTTNLRIHGVPSEVILGALDLDGVCVSAGSACSSGSINPSHVLLGMGLSREEARQCVRISWGRDTSADDIDTVARLVINHVSRIRSRAKRRI